MTDSSKRRFRSATIYDALVRATTRSFLLALDMDDEEMQRPHIGVLHTGGEMSPCNANLREQAHHAKTGPSWRSAREVRRERAPAYQGAVTHSGGVTWLRDEP